MSGHAWYKRYPEDFLNGTLDLTLEEKGAYSVCLDLMYSRGGPIPDDPKFISRACGCSMQLWNKLRAKLLGIGKLNVTDDNRLANGRATYEMQRSRAFAVQQSNRGKQGGRPKAEPITATATHPASPVEQEVARNIQLSSNLVGENLRVFEATPANINNIAKAAEKPLRDSERETPNGVSSEIPNGISDSSDSAVLTKKRAKRPAAQDHPRFAEFYAAYPRHDTGPEPVSAKFNAAIQAGADPSDIISGLKRYPFNSERQFQPLATTWLNQRRWKAEPAHAPKPQPGLFREPTRMTGGLG